jgi:Family of unknown function (DUF6713)
MPEILFWLYLTNTVLMIVHEMDSVYWKEWDLFGLPGGVTGFLMIHLPLLFLVLYGLVLVFQRTPAGLIVSLIISLAGLLGFGIHTYFIRKGRPEFTTPVSQFILWAMLIVSLAQAVVTIYLLRG